MEEIMKRLLVLFLGLVLTLSFISCGSNNAANMDYETSHDMATEEVASMEMAEAVEEEIGGVNYTASKSMDDSMSNRVTGTERKIIKSASMEMQTLEYDLAIQRLNDKIIAVGGYVESSNVRGRDIEDDYSTRSAHYTLRIPQKQFEQFMADMTTVGTIIQSNTYGEDVTTQMFDHEAHKKTLEIQEERLLTILSKAEKMEDIITLERELSNIRYEIEGLSGTLNRLQNLVSYSTLTVSIYEVHEIVEKIEKPKTLAEKISAKFNDSLEDITDFFEGLAIWAIGSLPLLIIYVPIILIFVLVFKKVYRTINPKVTYTSAVEDKKESKND